MENSSDSFRAGRLPGWPSKQNSSLYAYEKVGPWWEGMAELSRVSAAVGSLAGAGEGFVPAAWQRPSIAGCPRGASCPRGSVWSCSPCLCLRCSGRDGLQRREVPF